MSVLYLAVGSKYCAQVTAQVPESVVSRLSVLVSFFTVTDIHCALARKARYAMLDSGAFSAYTKGVSIDEQALIRFALAHEEFDEVVALDTIGDAAATFKSALRMKEAGLEVMPVFHIGEDWYFLDAYKDNFRKVGLSWGFGEKKAESKAWVAECFRRAWPCLFHSFGRVDFDILLRWPFDSADSSTPLAFMTFGHGPRRAKNKFRSLSSVTLLVYEWLRRESLLNAKWSNELKDLRQEKKPREWRR